MVFLDWNDLRWWFNPRFVQKRLSHIVHWYDSRIVFWLSLTVLSGVKLEILVLNSSKNQFDFKYMFMCFKYFRSWGLSCSRTIALEENCPRIIVPGRETVTVTDGNILLDNKSLGNIETSEVQYRWVRYGSYQFEENPPLVYKKTVYWKNNLLLLPSGQAGKQFIE